MQDAVERKQNLTLYVLIGTILIKRNLRDQTEVSCNNYFTIQILDVIFEFLVVKDKHILSSAQQKLFQDIPNSAAYLLERRCYLSYRLRYLVSVEGENNHNKIKTFLQHHRELASYLISHQGPMIDAAGRFFAERSAYGYLYWAGDTELLTLLDEFIDKATEKKLELEYNHIKKQGLDFVLNDELTTKSHHFPMKPVIKAAYEYDVAALRLIQAKNCQTSAWDLLKPLWLTLGGELGKVPLWIAQLFCSKLSFCPTSSLDTQDALKTIIFYNLLTDQSESWFIDRKPNPLLGVSIAIHKADGDRAWGFANPPADSLQRGMSDLNMLVTIYQQRMLRDPKRILKKLESETSDLDLDAPPQQPAKSLLF